MTSVIDSQKTVKHLYNKYVTLYKYICVLEQDLKPPAYRRKDNDNSLRKIYPIVPTYIATDYDIINEYCHKIYKSRYFLLKINSQQQSQL
ncbi:hypothetical protein AYR72_gp063 [Cnaphalocrocis medinalis granulovirus]|uniref:Dnapol n=1 Tax=Cnaphalocrocis medinalis granulovirus TaxID=1750712 RepID=A0A109WW70_9BBAC|nr:hypothetical protein AYR72_gp063 [Cnaphalocrocis medinalis granulovirus]ALN42003.1 hypothetical protein [Cnaphalocrocis medinalis granulovirus]AMF83815.1 hypothetical protein [Cnaphalocrocis medinalis granulovirus]WPN08693.1 hypothetical protein [Cnaphalocrocis medinalis granulovirus]